MFTVLKEKNIVIKLWIYMSIDFYSIVKSLKVYIKYYILKYI